MTVRSTRRMRSAFPALALLLLSASLWGTPAAQAQSTGRTPVALPKDRAFRMAFREVVAQATRSTVRVLCDDREAALGAIVGADGWILTKASELHGKIVVQLRDGRELPARMVGVKDDFDLALLKIEANGLTPVRWRDSKEDSVGNWVATPGMEDEPVAVGVLSVAARKITGPELTRRISRGGYLGIQIDLVKNGVKVARVMPKSAAEKAGFEVEDIILKIDGQAIPDAETLHRILGRKRPGDVVTVRVLRDDKEQELKPKLGRVPPDLVGREDRLNELGSKLSVRRSGFPVIFQHDAVLAPSDCGGPIVDLDGKVIGINIARAGRTESYAIPSEAVRPLLDDLKSGRLAPKK